MQAKARGAQNREISLAEKVAFLRRASSYGEQGAHVRVHESHMSFVFLVSMRAYKLKKPVRLSFLDFSTLARRQAACEAEFRLNKRLAPGIYSGVEKLTRGEDGQLNIGGKGSAVDFLVVMERIPEGHLLDHRIRRGRVEREGLNRLAARLGQFYRSARRVPLLPEAHLREWRRRLNENRQELSRSCFGLRSEMIGRIDCAQRRFVDENAALFADLVRRGRIVDGHGDLRPEHVALGERVSVIDCLEFSDRLRAMDPFDELAFLEVECEALGAAWVGAEVQRLVARILGRSPYPALLAFYRSYRAMMRARLTIAHLLDPGRHPPRVWRRRTKTYLAVAWREALALERHIASRATHRSRS